jgi:hypothetical protein
MFGNLIGVVLGLKYPLVIAFMSLWTLLKSCSIQLTFYTWFKHLWARLNPLIPDLTTIIHQILMQVYVLPHLPPQLHQLAYPKKSSLPPSTLDTTPPGTVMMGSASSGHTISDVSTVSSLTTLTIGSRGAWIANLHPISSFQDLVLSQIKFKDLVGASNPSKMSNGTEMCLSYVLCKGCWSNCKRVAHRAQQHL